MRDFKVSVSIEKRLIQATKISSITEQCTHFSQILFLHGTKLSKPQLAFWGKKWLQLASESLPWTDCIEISNYLGYQIGTVFKPSSIELNLWIGYVYTIFQRKEALKIFHNYLEGAKSINDERLILWGSLLSADANTILAKNFDLQVMTEILEFFQNQGEEEGLIRSLLARGRMHRATGDSADAELDFQQSCELAIKTKNYVLSVEALSWLGLSQRDQGKIEEAKASLQEALVLSLDRQDRRMAAFSSLYFGRIIAAEKPKEALKFLEQSVRYAKERNDPVTQSWAFNVIGELCQSLGQPERAIIFYDKTINLSQLYDTETLFWANFCAARILTAIGEDERALPYAMRATQFNIGDEMRSSYLLDSLWNMHARGLVALIQQDYNAVKQLLLPIRILIEEKNLEEASLIADELENAILSREMGLEVLSEIEKKQKIKKLQIFSPFSHLWKEK